MEYATVPFRYRYGRREMREMISPNRKALWLAAGLAVAAVAAPQAADARGFVSFGFGVPLAGPPAYYYPPPAYYYPPPVYYAPPPAAYAPAPYYAPAYVGPSIGLGFAFSSGGHGGHHHGHW